MLYAAEGFSGAGLFGLGFEIEGIEVGEVCELNPSAVATLQANFPDVDVVQCDAIDWTPRVPEGGIDILFGGPPCQPFSGAGAKRGVCDARFLFPEVIRWMRETQPRLVIAENVGSDPASRARAHAGLGAGILGNQQFLEWWPEALDSVGYEGTHWAVLAADYGSPQLRARVIFVAWPKGAPWGEALLEPPPITHASPQDAEELGLLPWTSGFERLMTGCCARWGFYSCGFLNNVGGACESCFEGNNYQMATGEEEDVELSEKALEYVMRVPERISKHRPADMGGVMGKGFVGWLAPTLVANLQRGVPYGLVIDPNAAVTEFTTEEDYRALRRLTVREAAKLMDVPQWFNFQGELGAQYRQVGNGVPVNLARTIARHVLTAFGEPLRDAFQPQEGLWPLVSDNTCRFTEEILASLRAPDNPAPPVVLPRYPEALGDPGSGLGPEGID